MRTVYLDAVAHETYSLKSRVLQRLARLTFQPILRWAPLNDRTLAWMRGIDGRLAKRRHSAFVDSRRLELAGVTAEAMTHHHGPPTSMTILYMHGGGFVSCGIETHRRICERLARKTGATVYSLDYTQVPDGPIAASVADAINAYQALLDIAPDPQQVVVAGDSAGGYLSLKVAELATRRGIPAPAAVLGFSPLVSVDPDRTDKGVEQVRRPRDAYLPGKRIGLIRPTWLPEGWQIEGEDSPLDAVDTISSPTFFVAVEDEILRPEIEAMAARLADRGVTVELHIWRGQVHAFPVLGKLLPESDAAIGFAADFARRAVGDA
jgi:acetyl esterase/lipase